MFMCYEAAKSSLLTYQFCSNGSETPKYTLPRCSNRVNYTEHFQQLHRPFTEERLLILISRLLFSLSISFVFFSRFPSCKPYFFVAEAVQHHIRYCFSCG